MSFARSNLYALLFLYNIIHIRWKRKNEKQFSAVENHTMMTERK